MKSRHWTEEPDRCGLATGGAHGQHEAVDLRGEERRTRAGDRRDACGALIGLCIEYVDDTLAAAHIDAMAFRVDEDVVGVSAGIHGRDRATILHAKHAKLCRIAKHHQHSTSL